MIVVVAPEWEDYQLLDTGNGLRLERFGKYTLVRPDPQAIWSSHLDKNEWAKADAVFEKGQNGKEGWVIKTNIPQKWLMSYKDLNFWARLTPFKHTGIFPEQSAQWEWLGEKIKSFNKPLNVLNLFAYTGIASLSCALNGAKVTHLDASKPTVAWAKENQLASNLGSKPIRWIIDDAIKFTQREIRRGVKYDGIIMDPPVYGHGAHGETWDFHKSLPMLLGNCREILSDQPLFILINAYAISSSALMLQNILSDFTNDLKGKIEVGELALKEEGTERLLSTGIFGRWSKTG